jgi:Spy/CpxP family protein refolding chaperone
MKPRLVSLVSGLIALSLVLFVLPAQAEGKKGDDKRAKVEQRQKQVVSKVLRQEVGLDEKKSEAVMKILAKHQTERSKLQTQHRQYRRDLRDLLQSDSSDEARYKKGVDGFRSTQKKLNALRDQEMDEIARLISPKEQAKLFAALERLRKKLGRRQRGPD